MLEFYLAYDCILVLLLKREIFYIKKIQIPQTTRLEELEHM